MCGELRGLAELLLVAENGTFEFLRRVISFFDGSPPVRLIQSTFLGGQAPRADLLRSFLYYWADQVKN